ncbi:MAG: hypothetical protein WAV20_00360 [Blastocatellia bacterium]
MKNTHSLPSILPAVVMCLLAGCHASETASDTASKATPAAASNANTTASSNRPSTPPSDANRNAAQTKQDSGSASQKTASPAELIGTYESREVLDKGVVTLISQLRTIWLFSADGHYSRVSQVKGKTYHADSGLFRIDPPDKLVLTIQMTGRKTKKVQNPPLAKTHIFSLSGDGDELRLTSEKGAVGIFRRVAKPKTS